MTTAIIYQLGDDSFLAVNDTGCTTMTTLFTKRDDKFHLDQKLTSNRSGKVLHDSELVLHYEHIALDHINRSHPNAQIVRI